MYGDVFIRRICLSLQWNYLSLVPLAAEEKWQRKREEKRYGPVGTGRQGTWRLETWLVRGVDGRA